MGWRPVRSADREGPQRAAGRLDNGASSPELCKWENDQPDTPGGDAELRRKVWGDSAEASGSSQQDGATSSRGLAVQRLTTVRKAQRVREEG